MNQQGISKELVKSRRPTWREGSRRPTQSSISEAEIS